MDFAEKIRGARAIMGWTRDDLADRSGLSVPGLTKIEQGSSPNARSQRRILRAFEEVGIKFSEKSIEKEENPVFFIEGKSHEEAYLRLLEEVFEHLNEAKNPELLIFYADDSVSPPAVNEMYRKMRAHGIKMRQLIEADNTYIIGPLEEYRYIPKEYFVNRVTLVYGDRIANETANVLRTVVRVDPINAEIQRNNFNLLWSILEQPTETTFDERF